MCHIAQVRAGRSHEWCALIGVAIRLGVSALARLLAGHGGLLGEGETGLFAAVLVELVAEVRCINTSN